MPQIEFKNVTKEYEDDKVLNKVSFGIDEGEFVFIVGSSGAGKSTLIKLLIREEFPTDGEVLFSGFETEDGTGVIDIPSLAASDLPELRRKIGVVFQDFKVLKSKTVFENVSVALEVVNTPEQDIKNVVPNVLGLVGLSKKMDKFPRQLSGGEVQRLSIARALAHEPDVLVADEPTGMVDPTAAKDIVKVLDKINSLGTTVIMATHDFSIVDNMKKRVVRIEDGKLVSDKKEGSYYE
jgi:cell division transport system ATP-binding protein